MGTDKFQGNRSADLAGLVLDSAKEERALGCVGEDDWHEHPWPHSFDDFGEVEPHKPLEFHRHYILILRVDLFADRE